MASLLDCRWSGFVQVESFRSLPALAGGCSAACGTMARRCIRGLPAGRALSSSGGPGAELLDL